MDEKTINLQQIIERIISKSHGFTVETDNLGRIIIQSNRIFSSEVVKGKEGDRFEEFERDVAKTIAGIKGHFRITRDKTGAISGCNIQFENDENSVDYARYNRIQNDLSRKVYENFKFTSGKISISISQINGKLTGAKYGRGGTFISTNIFAKTPISTSFGTGINRLLMCSIQVPYGEEYIGNSVKLSGENVEKICLVTSKANNLILRIKSFTKRINEFQNESAFEQLGIEFEKQSGEEYEIINCYDGQFVVENNGRVIQEETPEYKEYEKIYAEYIGAFENLQAQTRYSIAGMKERQCLEMR